MGFKGSCFSRFRWPKKERRAWTHRLFSNLKRWGLGVYHGLRKNEPPALPRRVRVPLQSALDTRHAAFDTRLHIGARTAPAPYDVLIRKTA